MVDAALQCVALERQGNELAHQYKLARQQQAGGKAGAAVKQTRAAARWQPWLARAAETPEQAMSALRREMMKKEKVDERTVRRILRQVK
jgi:hypothetical protein